MDRKTQQFINDFLKEIEEDNAAIFAGAGLSVASGHVDWKSLLKEFAEELDLDIQQEDDLVLLAQFHLNKNANNRHALSQKIANEFHHGKIPNINHEILARLPISTYWTTNYDRLIEKSLTNAGKIVDVKYKTNHLAQTIHGRDVILYKMHGDVEHSDEAIISKDQYEKYHQTHGAFVNTLSGDLVSKTFLFIGFSFTDPNLDYILSRVRVTFQNHQRKHYCIFRELKQEHGETKEQFEYKKIRRALIFADLLRFNIHVIEVKEYSEITDILNEIEHRYKRKTIYISGSAYQYGKWPAETVENFISLLSKSLVRNNFKIVSGFGLGVGSFVINGVLEEVYLNKKQKITDQLLLRPFPQGDRGRELLDGYRKDMISYAGISIFIFGNKKDGTHTILADGVRKEFEIAANQNVVLIPIGATGYVAKELWEKILSNYKSYFSDEGGIEIFKQLGDDTIEPDKLVSLILEFLNSLIKK
jgi:NAD-dependent SIR2 family protein deacetylase